jgi:cell division protein FtsN
MNTDMDRRGEAGFEFVLDNRKLILVFFLLIVVCGGFFVIGFVEGKRQAAGAGTAAPANAVLQSEQTPPAGITADQADADATPDPGPSVREQLEWYKRVNKAEAAGGLEPAADPARAVVETAEKPKPPVSAPVSEPPARLTARANYSVQVGAFRQLREAEAKAALLKKKGYDYTIEPPATEGQLFLLKVGRYDSRPEAHRMQLRLKKDGFASFIKANP